MKRIAILGAGRFGSSLATALAEAGEEVVVIDRNGSLVQALSGSVSFAVQGDATNARALEEAGVKECDIAVVAIGSNIEASTLATANCKELEVPVVIAKASSELHGRILKKLGADQIVFPDRDSAKRLAKAVSNYGALDLLELSEGVSLAEIDAPEVCSGKSLAQADVRKKYGVTVICVRRLDENPKKPRAIVVLGPNDVIRADDRLIVFGSAHDIDALTGRR